MQQQNFYPSTPSEEEAVLQKIILLYFIEKMDIPLSGPQVAQFALEQDHMNYPAVLEYLKELVEKGYLEKSQDINITRYTITDEGTKTVDLFIRRMSPGLRAIINDYVYRNRSVVKRDFEITANYFYDYNTREYVVKCCMYDNELMLMDLNLSVVSKEQATNIANNWRSNTSELYSHILHTLITRRVPANSDSHTEPL